MQNLVDLFVAQYLLKNLLKQEFIASHAFEHDPQFLLLATIDSDLSLQHHLFLRLKNSVQVFCALFQLYLEGVVLNVYLLYDFKDKEEDPEMIL